MSTDDSGDRTQKPTERRRREARARGEVARSSDLVSALILLSASVGLWWLGPRLGTELAAMMRAALTTSNPTAFDQHVVSENLLNLAMRTGLVAAPILLLIAGAAAASNLVQTGFLWVPNAIMPQLGRMDVGRNMSRWWSPSAWTSQFSSIIKLFVLTGVLLAYVRLRLTSAGPLVNGSASVIYTISMRMIGELAVVLSLSLVVLAIIDYGYQFWQAERRLMMTVEEVRREQREDEGNPALKRRQRELSQASRSVDASQPI